ncbi:MAG: thioesterase family protein [Candidatus Kapaibacterium sp.]
MKKDDLLLFKHKVQVRVRTWEVDWQGIVHNSYYLRYMEIGRLEYRRAFGYDLSPDGTFNDGLKVFVVHNSIDYHAVATLDDVLDVYTRISWIKNSSFCFEHVIVRHKDNSLLTTGKGILVNVDFKTNRPVYIPLTFIDEIKQYEIECNVMRE